MSTPQESNTIPIPATSVTPLYRPPLLRIVAQYPPADGVPETVEIEVSPETGLTTDEIAVIVGSLFRVAPAGAGAQVHVTHTPDPAVTTQAVVAAAAQRHSPGTNHGAGAPGEGVAQ